MHLLCAYQPPGHITNYLQRPTTLLSSTNRRKALVSQLYTMLKPPWTQSSRSSMDRAGVLSPMRNGTLFSMSRICSSRLARALPIIASINWWTFCLSNHVRLCWWFLLHIPSMTLSSHQPRHRRRMFRFHQKQYIHSHYISTSIALLQALIISLH